MNEAQLYQEYLSAMAEIKPLIPEMQTLKSSLSQINLDELKQINKDMKRLNEITSSPAYQEALAEWQAIQPTVSALADEMRELNELIALSNTPPLNADIR